MLRAHDAPRPVEQPVLLDSMMTGICLNTLLCLIKEQVW